MLKRKRNVWHVANNSNHMWGSSPHCAPIIDILTDTIMTKKVNAAKTAQVESVNNSVANNEWTISLQGIKGVRTMKQDKKIDKNILIISRTPKQTIAAMNGIMDMVVDESGMTLRQRLTEAGIVVGKNGLTLKEFYAGWAWKDDEGQLLHLTTRIAKIAHEDAPDQVVYGFNPSSKKWESFKQIAVDRIGFTTDFMGKDIYTGWSIAMILDGLRQMQHLDEYKTKQMEFEKAWNDAKKVYTFEKVQNKGGMNNKAHEVNKTYVQFL